MISGGLNGGEVPIGLTLEIMVASILAVVTLVAFIVILIEALPVAIAAVGITAAVLLNMILMYQMYDAYYDYIYSGDLGAYSDTEDKALQLVALASCEAIVAQFVYALFVLLYVAGQSSGGSANTSWYNPDGSINYPPNNGAVSGTEKMVTFEVGDTIGRYGEISEYSTFVTQTGVDADKLALPPNVDPNIYQEYVVIKPIPETISSVVAPWGGSPGGGIQYNLPHTLKWLIENGYLIKK